MRCPTCGIKMAKVTSDIDQYYECRNLDCLGVWDVHIVGNKEDIQKPKILDIGVSNELPFKTRDFDMIVMFPEPLNHCDRKLGNTEDKQ